MKPESAKQLQAAFLQRFSGIKATRVAIALSQFASYFKPECKACDDPWFGDDDDPESREHRVMALLLMAEMAETGELQ